MCLIETIKTQEWILGLLYTHIKQSFSRSLSSSYHCILHNKSLCIEEYISKFVLGHNMFCGMYMWEFKKMKKVLEERNNAMG